MAGAGELKQSVWFESPTSASDGHGGTTSGWTEEFESRARYRYLRGSEAVMASRLQGRQPVIVTVRCSRLTRTVTTDWRIRDARDGRIFNIRAIEMTPDRAYIEILAETGVAT